MKKVTAIILAFFAVLDIQSQVNQQWVIRFNGSANSFDIAHSIKIDDLSNVYVYGTSSTSGSSTDIMLTKYNSSGAVLWARLYNGTANSLDQTTNAFIDNSGNSYVTGFSTDSSNNQHVVNLKYNSNGDLLWANTF